jgi:hypothetical protein
MTFVGSRPSRIKLNSKGYIYIRRKRVVKIIINSRDGLSRNQAETR